MRSFHLLAVAFAANLCVGALAPLARAWQDAPREQVRRAFEKAPAVGEPLPDVKVFDSAGQPFHLRELRGRNSVLVFGCLT